MPKKIQAYLGVPASNMLNDNPFDHWGFERSVTEDLDPQIIHYVFAEHGLELRCDDDNKISVIFIFTDRFGGLDDSLLDFPHSLNRRQVLQRFGEPSKSGNASNHPVLGNYGAWDRFSMQGYAIRFEYSTDEGCIKKITFMREDVVP